MYRPRFSLRKIAYFVAIAETGTVVEAANRLNISQSALTDAISALEHESGVQLLQRRKAKGSQLTAHGQKLLRMARDLLRASEEFEATIDSIENRVKGELNIGCYPTLMPRLAPKLILEMKQTYPQIQLNFIEANQDILQQKLSLGEIDAALAYQVNISKQLKCHRLFQLKPYILISPEHRFANREIVHLKEICSDDMIMLDLYPSLFNTESFFKQHNLKANISHRTSSVEFLRSMVARNLGYSMLVHRTKTNLSQEGLPFLVKEIAEELTPNYVSLIHDQYQETPKKLKALLEIAQKSFPSDFY